MEEIFLKENNLLNKKLKFNIAIWNLLPWEDPDFVILQTKN